ncbi:MAG: hypothetical protein DHS20C01_14860 [marine bacterium B5-7]|nr:MAG: hypothetical protein DHS20C01_14860 [marine bacterium B5-7]
MKILITGGAGFLGHRLALKLLEKNTLRFDDEHGETINELVLLDHVDGPRINDPRIRQVKGDISQPGVIDDVIDKDTKVIFHLAAVVSGQAETEFDLGMSINLDASRHLLEVCRRLGHCPRIIFTSSIAVYGGELPELVVDTTPLNPLSSYGVAKAMAEMLLGEYARRQFVDGRVLRLPTVSIRPGRPNLAASSFASSIIREPLNGEEAVCPVPATTRLWLMSPRCAIDSLIHGSEVNSVALGDNRAINLSGMSITVADMLASLRQIAGDKAYQLVRFEPDIMIQNIVGGWPGAWDINRAQALGFPINESFDKVIRDHIDNS